MENENKSSNNNMLMIAGVVGAIIIIGGAVLLMSSKSSSTTPTPVTNNTNATNHPISATVNPLVTPSATGSNTAVKTFNLEGKNFAFSPKELKVKQGEKVKVVLKVMDMQHDFVIDELGVRTKVGKAGETVEVEFTPDQAGEFEFYCSVGNHRAQGMTGTIIVEE